MPSVRVFQSMFTSAKGFRGGVLSSSIARDFTFPLAGCLCLRAHAVAPEISRPAIEFGVPRVSDCPGNPAVGKERQKEGSLPIWGVGHCE